MGCHSILIKQFRWNDAFLKTLFVFDHLSEVTLGSCLWNFHFQVTRMGAYCRYWLNNREGRHCSGLSTRHRSQEALLCTFLDISWVITWTFCGWCKRWSCSVGPSDEYQSVQIQPVSLKALHSPSAEISLSSVFSPVCG